MIVALDDDGQRLDRFLKKKFPDLAFGQLQKLLRTGQIRIDGKRVKGDAKLQKGQDLRLPPQLSNAEVASKTTNAKDTHLIRSLVIYEDEDVVAIDKPAGLAVQGGSSITRHVDGMLNGLTGKNGVRPRLVHRLDKDTSGVLVLARSAEAARRLATAFAGRDTEKIYYAITAPAPKKDTDRIDAALTKGMAGSDVEKMMQDDEIGKPAITDYRVLARAPNNTAALVEFLPLTGRTHQIRVHASLIGCPLWGDRKYGGSGAERFYLHARFLELTHPKTDRPLHLEAPLPAAFKTACQKLGIPIRDA